MKAHLKTILPTALLLGGLVALTPQAHAQGGVPLWTNRYNGPAKDVDDAEAVVVDNTGNVFVTGGSVGGSPTSGGTSYDYATVAYSSAGVPLWTNRYNGPDNSYDCAKAVAVDSSGNVFVTGESAGTNGYPDYATVAYSNTGVPLWTNRYHGSGNGFHNARAIAVDSSGNVFVTGYSDRGGFNYDYATVAYSGAGVPLWTNRYHGPGNGSDFARAVAVDSSGNVFVTGESAATNGGSHYATLAYSGAGVPLWTNCYNGPRDEDDGFAVVVDKIGNVFVTGQSAGSNGCFDYAIVAYSNTGAPLWTNRYQGPGTGNDEAAIAVDSNGNVFVTGESAGTNGYSDYATVAYSNTGVPLWTNRYHGLGSLDYGARAVAVDSSGNVFVAGCSLDSNGHYDYATVAYSGTGVPLWTNCYNGPTNLRDCAIAVAVDRGGSVFVTGGSSNGNDDDYVTIKYAAIVPRVHLDFQMLNNQLVLSWANPAFSLQSAPAVTGTFTTIPGATSPYTNSITGPQQYFRLKAN